MYAGICNVHVRIYIRTVIHVRSTHITRLTHAFVIHHVMHPLYTYLFPERRLEFDARKNVAYLRQAFLRDAGISKLSNCYLSDKYKRGTGRKEYN